jgi:hypothetical protein
MALGTASDLPNLQGVYIPQVWSGKMLVKFYAATVFGMIANTDYEGEIKGQGDRVEIRTIPDITIRDYVPGTPLEIQKPNPNKIELQIGYAKYYNFLGEDIQVMQSDLAYLDKWTTDASEQMKIAVDKSVLGNVYTQVSTFNQGNAAGAKSGSINLGVSGTPVQLTASNVLDVILDANTCMDEQNIPENDRFIVLPPWAVNKIKRSDLQSAMITGDSKSPLRNGLVGTIDRTLVMSSNNLSQVLDSSAVQAWNCIFGQKSGISFASQLVKNETVKAESTFGMLYRGLQVYGFNVNKPEALGRLYIRR